MRPVARIAQSVEQGIENPRVLGSIPSPGTTIQRTRSRGGFLLLKKTITLIFTSALQHYLREYRFFTAIENINLDRHSGQKRSVKYSC